MKRLINIRIPLIFAFSLIAGIALSRLFINFNINLFYIIAVVPFTAVIVVITAFFHKSLIKIIIVIFIALIFILGLTGGYVKLKHYGTSSIVDGASYTVSAVVCEKGETQNSEYIILKNLHADGEKINGKMIVYLGKTYGDFCDIGYKVEFTAEISRKDLFTFGKLNNYVQSNVKYSCFVINNLKAEYGFSFFGSIRSHIRDTLYDNLDGDTAAIAFAMLTGNTQDVDEGAMQNFRYGGIAHIFAVSGLHIGIVYAALFWILKKFNLNKYVNAILCLSPLFFYAGICGFTMSSLRAVVMCTVSVLARLTHKKYDSLNALSLSVIIILLITPLSLFSAGFQLSVCATGSIILLSKNIVRPFKKLPRNISSAIGVSLSAQAGTMPVMLSCFGYLSWAGLLMNIIILPILSVVFVVIFISTLIASVIPPFAVVLPYAFLPLQLIISIFLNTSFEKAVISGLGAAALLPFYIALLALSDKINLKLKYRLTAIICVTIFICVNVLSNVFAPLNGYKIIVSANYGGGVILIKSKGENILIVTENLSPTKTQPMLNEYYAFDLSAVIILGGEDCVSSYGDFELNCKNLYVYYGYINVQPYKNCTVNYESRFILNEIEFAFADGYSLTAKCGNTQLGICAGDYVPFENCDLFVSDADGDCENIYRVSFENRNIEYCIYDCGDLVFNCGNEIKLKK